MVRHRRELDAQVVLPRDQEGTLVRGSARDSLCRLGHLSYRLRNCQQVTASVIPFLLLLIEAGIPDRASTDPALTGAKCLAGKVFPLDAVVLRAAAWAFPPTSSPWPPAAMLWSALRVCGGRVVPDHPRIKRATAQATAHPKRRHGVQA